MVTNTIIFNFDHLNTSTLVVQPVQPTTIGKLHFKIHLEPFDERYGDLGDFKVIVIAGNPVKYNLVPTKTQIPDKVLPKSTGQCKANGR